jgi:hypothetical protein
MENVPNIPDPSIAFVTCLEAGPLEQQVIRMVASLRKWGGRFSNAPVYAVNPRFDILKINPATFRSLENLGVKYLSVRPKSPFPWFRFLNKPVSVAAVESRVSTEMICFLDGDILVVREPGQLDLGTDFDFAACVRDKGGIGTTGPGDPNERYWELMCQALGMRIDDLPFATALYFGERIRLYFNSGVLVYRRNTLLGEKWHDDCLKLLHARIAHPQHNIYFTDQAALSLTAVRLGLRIRQLGYSHNHGLGKLHFHAHRQDELEKASLLHYHEAMNPDHWDQFLKFAALASPEVTEWLRPQGPIRNTSSLRRTLRNALRSLRYLQQLAHVRKCRTT